MISTYQFKSRFQTLLRPLAAWLYRAGVTANQVTTVACLISVALGAAALAQPDHNYLFVLISFWCLLRMAANALDGMLAREFGQASRLGAALNEAGDVISDIALYLPFAFVAGSDPRLVVTIVLLAACSEFAGWLGAVKGRARGHEGPMGKSDRALVFGAIAMLIGCGMAVAPYLYKIWIAIAAMLALTIYNRVRSAFADPKGIS